MKTSLFLTLLPALASAAALYDHRALKVREEDIKAREYKCKANVLPDKDLEDAKNKLVKELGEGWVEPGKWAEAVSGKAKVYVCNYSDQKIKFDQARIDSQMAKLTSVCGRGTEAGLIREVAEFGNIGRDVWDFKYCKTLRGIEDDEGEGEGGEGEGGEGEGGEGEGEGEGEGTDE
ncbi:unnamed protein product [Periconia digitata]|uniref:Uncharacterized protein n=1 Tax=Periconia digitata TaxID=1303443 RepID=A0A9W4UW96_9PLEO|nr:unnamed protein product [Periconia digitata]